MKSFKKYAIMGLGLNIVGFALGFAGQGLYQLGIVSLGSGFATLEPFGDLLFGLGIVVIVAASARSGVEMKYIVIAGAVIGIGLFYKSALHEIHIASGIGLGLPHTAHVGLGAILITISAGALTVLSLRSKGDIEVKKSVQQVCA
jgi:hypothetical protein